KKKIMLRKVLEPSIETKMSLHSFLSRFGAGRTFTLHSNFLPGLPRVTLNKSSFDSRLDRTIIAHLRV
ncbi:unnamed protein product, partial [Candidula unifasciata]